MHTRPELDGSNFRFGGVTKTTSKEPPVKIAGHGLPLTPAQEELLCLINTHNQSPYVSFRLPIPEHLSPSIDLIRHAWRAVASHNPNLRARLDRSSGQWKLHISRHIPDIESPSPAATRQTDHSRSARLTVSLSDGRLWAWIEVHRALIDDQSLPLICDDFESFLHGVALSQHTDFESFIDRTAKRDQNAAKLYWRAQPFDIATAPIHGFPTRITTLSSYAVNSLSKEETLRVHEFAAACQEPIHSVLYAAWAATLASHTESGTNLITFAVTGRHTSLDRNEHLVGPGDQIYPLVVDTNPAQLLTDMIKSIASADRNAAKYAFIGYNAILDQLVEPEGPTLVAIRTNRQGYPLEVCHSSKGMLLGAHTYKS